MAEQEKIVIRGLRQNNLKNITLEIPKRKIVVFTGVSGSGKSSIVFDTVAAEASRQMNETYPAFVRGRLPKFTKPNCDSIEGLSPCVIIDQAPLGATARSTVGTSSEIYSGLRLLFARIGAPYAGAASFFSFNDPEGMCPECSGLGLVTDIDLAKLLDPSKSLNGGAVQDSMFHVGSWYWKQFAASGFFDPAKPVRDYSTKERNLFLYGNENGYGDPVNPKVPGLLPLYRRRYITRDTSELAFARKKGERFISQRVCPRCHGKRLNRKALACWINGFSIADFCDMELTDLRDRLREIDNPSVKELTDSLVRSLTRMIEIGLGYLSLSRPTQSLSGGEAQRVKLVRFLGSSLTDMLYIFDEPTTGMHPRDVHRMNKLLVQLRDKGNTVLVVEHDPDMIAIADEVIDIGPFAGSGGGEIVFQGPYEKLLQADTATGRALRAMKTVPSAFRKPIGFLPVRDAALHNLRHCAADIPEGVICAVTGVAGSGKSSLMSVFAAQYADRVVKIDQKPITATNRSTPASYLGIMDAVRRLFADANGVDEGFFSFNSTGACPHCKGKGVIVTELAFMDPIVTTCEHCGGTRYRPEALALKYCGINIIETLALTAHDALNFFNEPKIQKVLKAMEEVGLSYLTLGQPLSSLSGGELQRIKLAANLKKKGSVYLLDEPTTGLHPSDIDKLLDLFRRLVAKNNSVILIEHNTEVMKMADYIIDIGPDGGKNGGEVVFAGTPLDMIRTADTITARCLRKSDGGGHFTEGELCTLTAVKPAENKKREEDEMKLNPIGRVESDNGEFKVVLDKKLAPALQGLEGFSHVQIIWWFDDCDAPESRSHLQNQKPYKKGPEILGAFATRSPERPNPIALSIAEVKSIDFEKGVLELFFIDADTGSPVLDIKPYTPSLDRVESATVPGWCKHWPSSYEKSATFDWSAEFNFQP